MAHSDQDSSCAASTCQSSKDFFSVSSISSPTGHLPVPEVSSTGQHYNNIPRPPPLPSTACAKSSLYKNLLYYTYVPKETKDTWERLFEEGYHADVLILTKDKASIPAHSSILGMASPVLRIILDTTKVRAGLRYVQIAGVPSGAVHVFVRFLYSSGYEQEEMKKFVLHLLVLSHVFSVPSLKKVSVDIIEQSFLTADNVIDVLQLARECDAPRLSLFCVRLVIKNFNTVSRSEGWKVMKQANPILEQELLESVVEADSGKQGRLKRMEEKQIYLQLYEAMEALLHICREGCRSIGPRDKMLKGSQVACGFTACKGIESLVRHFSGCKTRVPNGCVHCKRMWQLLELHSRMCSQPDSCKVPLCRHFKEKMRQQSKKDDAKWKLLVSKVTSARTMMGPFSSPKVTRTMLC